MALPKKSLLTNLSILILGIVIGYWLFFTPQITDTIKQQNPIELSEIEFQHENNHLQTATAQDQRIAQLLEEIKQLKTKLNQLTHKKSLTVQNPSNQLKNGIASKTVDNNLTKMNIEDFNNMMQKSILSRSRSIILQFDNNRIEELKKDFENLPAPDEWSTNYQDKISQFITENDNSGDLFINSVDCRISLCRLEVNTNGSQQWEELYLKMSQQAWFQSVTIQEKTDYPDTIIYYLIK